ncbi:MAG: amidohydrolase, partial [Ramlibacter sp.]|nr:amidohydrolase [Ramlibacter sp.]
DGHTAMLLGAAKYLAKHRDFDGIVNFIFQPAEEGGNAGAKAMMKDGLFQKFPCDEIYGIHNMPGFPVGHFAFRKGPAMASSNRFDIIVRGTGGHAAQPHKAVDTIVIAAELVGALQTLISRHKNPIDVAVVSVTQIHAGDAYNVLPGEAVIKGTVRTFSTEVLDDIESNMRRMAEMLPQAHGGSGELKFHRAYPPLVNWDAQTEFAMKVAQDVFGADKVDGNTPQHGGAEDFSFYLQEVPGSYLFLGNGEGAHREEKYIGMGPCELHNPNYDFNDALLPTTSATTTALPMASGRQLKPLPPTRSPLGPAKVFEALLSSPVRGSMATLKSSIRLRAMLLSPFVVARTGGIELVRCPQRLFKTLPPGQM